MALFFLNQLNLKLEKLYFVNLKNLKKKFPRIPLATTALQMHLISDFGIATYYQYKKSSQTIVWELLYIQLKKY